VALFCLLLALELLAVVWLNGGPFTYTLDDPYIHLALAEQIAVGHYGINAGEFAAPSSSILWPLLLTPFVWLRLDAFAPLALNVAAALGTMVLFDRWLGRVLGDTAARLWARPLLLALLVLSTNQVGLVLLGMEHTLQILLALLMLLGLAQEQASRRAPWWLGAAIVLGPLVRYENLALALPALGYLGLRGHWRLALGCALGLLAGVGGFSLLLSQLGLGYLPSSVLAKSAPVGMRSPLVGLWFNLSKNLSAVPGLLFGAGLLLLGWKVARGARHSGERLLGLWALLALTGHLVLGDFGWFARYEMYAWAVLLLMLLRLWRAELARFLSSRPPWLAALFLGLAVMAASPQALLMVALSPRAANDIYLEQYQMQRFVRDYYRQPVAVNDIGLVAYGSDVYVLDMWGLAQREALWARWYAPDSAWMDELASRRDVRLVMIFDRWFPERPAHWIRLGSLQIERERVIPTDLGTAFYARDAATAEAVRAQLHAFAGTLPPGVRFVFAVR
jgi:hypothetical protein